MGVQRFHSEAKLVKVEAIQQTLFSAVTFQTGRSCFWKLFQPNLLYHLLFILKCVLGTAHAVYLNPR